MECHSIPEIPYGEFSKGLREKLGGARIPLNGSLELSLKCNFRCKHCYVSHGHNPSPDRIELSTAEVKRILDEITEMGCLWLLITGGDPLIRKDFPEIWEYAKKKGLILTLFTNGSLVTPQIADFLAEWRPFSVEITVYGATEETYERVTGIRNSYRRAMRGINLLLERKIPLKLKTMVMTLNRHEFEEIRALADRLGCEFRFDPVVNGGIELTVPTEALRIPVSDILQIESQDPIRAAFWEKKVQELPDRGKPLDNLYNCYAGIRSFHIDAYGKLMLCMVDRSKTFNLCNASFKQGWMEFLPHARMMKPTDQYECHNCYLRDICAQCPAYGYLEYGDPECRVEFLCELTHKRVEHYRARSTTFA